MSDKIFWTTMACAGIVIWIMSLWTAYILGRIHEAGAQRKEKKKDTP